MRHFSDIVEFDFEDQLRLPAQAGRSNDPRHHTVVCRHWLRGLCQKGEDCEFLHRMDLEKMPICRWGNECQVTDCQFRHVDDEDKPECAHYRQGFCRHGPGCRYRHIKLPPEELPPVADFSLNITTFAGESAPSRDGCGAGGGNDMFKTSMCKQLLAPGSCPFGDNCQFAHDESELRPIGGGGRAGAR
ncbi:unnamed protein product [Phaeothamnion confervicola]